MAFRTMGQLLRGVFILINCGALAGTRKNATGDNFDSAPVALGNFSYALGAFGLANIDPGANDTATDGAADYEPQSDGGEEALPAPEFHTEFLTFTAPEDEDSEEIEELVKLLQPKRILLIDTPDAAPDVLTMAEQQLESEMPLDTYVFRRAAVADSFADQLRLTQQQSQHEAAMHFVNYRSVEAPAEAEAAQAEEVEAAEQMSASMMHDESGPDGGTEEANSEPSIIFKIATRGSIFYQTFDADDFAEDGARS